jgi:coenzyme F420-reducing hydrogenase delta subunit
MFNISAAMAKGFADAVRTMTERSRKLGPNPLRKDGPQSKENVN